MVMHVTWNELLEALKKLIEDAIKDLLLPIRAQNKDDESDFAENPDHAWRKPDVYLMRLPDSKEAKKKAPYVLVQLITAADWQDERQIDDSVAVVRIICCVYDKDEQTGALNLLNLGSRIRITLLKTCTAGSNKAFVLDKTEKLEFMAYPDDTAPYYAGEMIGTWHLPPISREVRLW